MRHVAFIVTDRRRIRVLPQMTWQHAMRSAGEENGAVTLM